MLLMIFFLDLLHPLQRYILHFFTKQNPFFRYCGLEHTRIIARCMVRSLHSFLLEGFQMVYSRNLFMYTVDRLRCIV